jgi:hypothetical protein
MVRLYNKTVIVMLNEDSIETFIRENKDKFGIYPLPDNHMEKFLFKLNYRIRHLISIVPYLIRVAAATVLIFAASFIVWNNYIRKDRYEISLRNKITLVLWEIRHF